MERALLKNMEYQIHLCILSIPTFALHNELPATLQTHEKTRS